MGENEKPIWTDYSIWYFPNEMQANLLNLSNVSYHAWVNDRITSQQFKLHWQQQKDLLKRQGKKKPLFMNYLTIESHIPYNGYDSESFYDSIPSWLQKKKTSDENKKFKFMRVNKYADKYAIGSTIEWLRKNDNNTIYFITGDHSTRDMPMRKKNSELYKDVVFSGDCVGNPSGVDSLFVVTGVMNYLGDNPKVKKLLGLDKYSGKVVKIATDHNDLTYTLMETVSKLNGHSLPPTHKRARNLAKLTETLVTIIDNNTNCQNQHQNMIFDEKNKKLDQFGNSEQNDQVHQNYQKHQNSEQNKKLRKVCEESGVNVAKKIEEYLGSTGYQSMSMLSYQIDYRNGSQLLRTHTDGYQGAHYYSGMSYPSCIKKKGSRDLELGGNKAREMYKSMIEYMADENYLMINNKLYNYQFRDRNCILNRNCAFPEAKRIKINDNAFLLFYAISILGGAGIGGLIELIIFLVNVIKNKFDSHKRMIVKPEDDEKEQPLNVEPIQL